MCPRIVSTIVTTINYNILVEVLLEQINKDYHPFLPEKKFLLSKKKPQVQKVNLICLR